MTAEPPAISVVVMGYRNEHTIARATKSLVRQSPVEPWEVVVVTSGGDGSAPAVRSAFPGLAVVERQERITPGEARNLGITHTRGRIVAFLAADCVAEAGWIDGRLAAHRDGNRVVAGAMTFHGASRPWAWAAHYILFSSRLPGRPRGIVSYPDPAGHGLSFERDVLERAGPFQTSAVLGEDTDMAGRVAKLGVGTWFEPAVRTSHAGPTSTGALLREMYRRSMTAAVVGRAAEPPSTVTRETRSFPKSWSDSVLWTLVTAWKYGRGERLRLLAASPWIALGCAAGAVGRKRAQ